MSLEELKNEARLLGISIDGRWSEKKILKAIDAAGIKSRPSFVTPTEKPMEAVEEIKVEEPKQEKCLTIQNMTKSNYTLGSISIKNGDIFELSPEHMKDEMLQRIINRHVETKHFRIVD